MLARRCPWTLLRLVALLSVLLCCAATSLVGCEREPSEEAQALPELQVSLQLVEGRREAGAVVGQTTAELVIDGDTARLSWSSQGDAVPPPPMAGEVELERELRARLVKIVEKTQMQHSLSVNEPLEPTGEFATLTGTVALAGDSGAYDVRINEAVPLDAHTPAGKDAVFKIDAARTLVGEVARALQAQPAP